MTEIGKLYIVGTPIGNLADMTWRAVSTLQTVDLIAAEDTRHTGRLLQHFQITTPQISYHEHNQQQRIPQLIAKILAGQAIALVTDAGMPGISDPGYELVSACIAEEILVIPIPGVSASITALSVSGLPTDQFYFLGFLPVKEKFRQISLQNLLNITTTTILYESPHRLLDTLQDLAKVLGDDRQIAIARELTKLYEEFWRGTLAGAIAHFTTKEPKGEFTLVLAGTTEQATIWSEAMIKQELQILLEQGLSRSQASRQLAQKSQLARQDIYQIALTLSDN